MIATIETDKARVGKVSETSALNSEALHGSSNKNEKRRSRLSEALERSQWMSRRHKMAGSWKSRSRPTLREGLSRSGVEAPSFTLCPQEMTANVWSAAICTGRVAY